MQITQHTDERGEYLGVLCRDGETVFLVDAADRAIVEGKGWFILPNRSIYCRHVARSTWIDGKSRVALVSRDIMQPPPGMTVDHRFGDPLNNRRYALRNCTMAQNIMSKHHFRRSATGFRGVYAEPNGRYKVLITIGNRSPYLGMFDDPIEAARVWDAVALAERGEFAQLNFPEEP